MAVQANPRAAAARHSLAPRASTCYDDQERDVFAYNIAYMAYLIVAYLIAEGATAG